MICNKLNNKTMTQEELDILNTIPNEDDKVKFINECYQKMLDKLDLDPMVQQISDYCNRHIMHEMKKNYGRNY
jgi:hypothetical protein